MHINFGLENKKNWRPCIYLVKVIILSGWFEFFNRRPTNRSAFDYLNENLWNGNIAYSSLACLIYLGVVYYRGKINIDLPFCICIGAGLFNLRCRRVDSGRDLYDNAVMIARKGNREKQSREALFAFRQRTTPLFNSDPNRIRMDDH
jgi:hypothetical protein